jgi:hypothetical protein
LEQQLATDASLGEGLRQLLAEIEAEKPPANIETNVRDSTVKNIVTVVNANDLNFE